MIPKFSLGFFPTPLHKLKNLSKLYPNHNFYIKRDDQTGLATGGNKTRKLEYLIQDAIINNCDTIITAGAQQSNHCRQTAAACAKANLKCHLLLGGEKPELYNGNLLLSKQLGATIHFTGENRKGENIEELYATLQNQNYKPYIIPYGGSNFTGTLGYVNAIKELKEQLISQNIKIDAIVFASSSGGTQAGMILGKTVYNLDVKLIPISIDKKELNGKSLNKIVYSLVKIGLKKFNSSKKISSTDCKLITNYHNSGYGEITPNEVEAINLLAKSEGILLDPVYSARAFYGMIDMVKNNKFDINSNILFWHTGGIPANFYYADKLN
jgi:D-cysteine desulfhydrase family pyridoxal phosphate-dependent enzyme